MALVFTVRVNDADGVDQTAYTTPAFTPSASADMLVALHSNTVTAPAAKGTLDSPTWLDGVWTERADVLFSGATDDTRRLTLYSGRTVAVPGSDDVTASFGATQSECHIIVIDITGALSILQPKTVQGTVAATSASITLDNALAASTSAMLAFFAKPTGTEAHAPTGGETELLDNGVGGVRTSAQYELNDTTSGASWTNSLKYAIAAVEVSEEAASPSLHPNHLLLLNVGK